MGARFTISAAGTVAFSQPSWHVPIVLLVPLFPFFLGVGLVLSTVRHVVSGSSVTTALVLAWHWRVVATGTLIAGRHRELDSLSQDTLRYQCRNYAERGNSLIT